MIELLLGIAAIIAIVLLIGTVLNQRDKIKDLEEIVQRWVDWSASYREEVLADAAAQMKKSEKDMRADAIARSQVVLKGKIAEQLAPFMPEFDYNPRDCRFLGSPIDYVCFEGLSDGELTDIAFVEIKTGKSRLSVREYQVQQVIESGAVTHEVIRLE